MLPTIPPDAPWWVVPAFWVAFVVFAAFFANFTPWIRSWLGRVAPAPSQPDATMKVQGAILGGGLDATKLAYDLERIAEALEVIADAAKSLAKSEEQGTARALEAMRDQLSRLDRKVDGR